MPFEIVRNDITSMRVDAIVNTANPKPVIGAGCDSAIHKKAGPMLLEARKVIGNILPGQAKITRAFDLNAAYVIHTVGPIWQGGSHNEETLLRQCYAASLSLAAKYECKSIAFPLLSTGTYAFPKDKALQIAIQAFSTFLLDHEMQIYLVVFDKTAFSLSEKLFSSVSSYIDEHYVGEKNREEYGIDDEAWLRNKLRRRREAEAICAPSLCESVPIAYGIKATNSLDELLQKTDAGFSETLLRLIDESGEKDSAIYHRANITRQHFSKIRNNPYYQPTKSTAVAFAVALHLDMNQTEDLLRRAGYVLNNNSKFDVIIRYFIEHKNYDIFEINATLFHFDQSTLGS